jgi:hypothetical protein
VVDAAFLQQVHRTHAGVGELAGQGFVVVVEVDEHRLAATGLDEAVGVTVELVRHLLARDVLQEVLHEDVDLEVRHRSSLGCRDVVGITEGEDGVELGGQSG